MDIKDIAKEVMKANLKKLDLDKPADKSFTPVEIKAGDKFRMTMQGLGGRELYLIEVIREWDKS